MHKMLQLDASHTASATVVRFGNSWCFLLAAILLFAVIVRLVFSFGIARGLLHLEPQSESTDRYHEIARSLYEGEGYRFKPKGPLVTERAPAYPLFLAGVFSIAGVDYAHVQIAQAFLGSLSCFILFLFGRWLLSVELGLIAAALFAIYPTSIEYSARLYAENLYFPIFLSFAYLLCRAAIEGSVRCGLLVGISWGVSLLTRGTLLPLPLLLPIGIALSRVHRSPPSRWISWTLPALIAGTLMVTPWTIRNYAVTGAFVPVSTWGWAPLYHGTQVSKRMTEWVDLMAVDIAATRHVRSLFVRLENGNVAERTVHSAVLYDELAKELTIAEWRNDPYGTIQRAVVGVGFAWFFTFGAKLRVVSLAIHLPLFILFVMGVVHMARQYREVFWRAWPALCLIIFVNLFYAVAYPHVRYMSPAIALSFLFSAVPLMTVFQRFTKSPGKSKKAGQVDPAGVDLSVGT